MSWLEGLGLEVLADVLAGRSWLGGLGWDALAGRSWLMSWLECLGWEVEFHIIVLNRIETSSRDFNVPLNNRLVKV